MAKREVVTQEQAEAKLRRDEAEVLGFKAGEPETLLLPAGPRSWRPEVIADSSGKWTPNGLRFHTEGAAFAWAEDLAARWALVRDYRAAPSEDEPNQNDEVLAADRESWRLA